MGQNAVVFNGKKRGIKQVMKIIASAALIERAAPYSWRLSSAWFNEWTEKKYVTTVMMAIHFIALQNTLVNSPDTQCHGIESCASSTLSSFAVFTCAVVECNVALDLEFKMKVSTGMANACTQCWWNAISPNRFFGCIFVRSYTLKCTQHVCNEWWFFWCSLCLFVCNFALS